MKIAVKLLLCDYFLLLLPHHPSSIVRAIGTDNGHPDYSNMAVRWERRTLYCEASTNGLFSGKCFLTKGTSDETEPQRAHCHEELHEEEQSGAKEYRSHCDIECAGADRDSVISKFPNSSRDCIRYHTFNTMKRRKEGEPSADAVDHGASSAIRWFLWRSNKCRLVEISLEVHCGFP